MSSVDVIIPAHNASTTLAEALRSVLEQTLPPARVIVVADACSDETVSVAEEAGVEVVEIRERNVSRARMAGIERSGSAWLAFLDADDVWEPTWLAAAVGTALCRPNAALVYGCVWDEYPDGRMGKSRPSSLSGGDIFDRLLIHNFITTSATLVRRASIERWGGFNPRYRNGEDWDLWLRLAAREEVWPVSGCHVRYRVWPTSATRNIAGLWTSRHNQLCILKNTLGLREVSSTVRRRSFANLHLQSAIRFIAHDCMNDAREDLLSALRVNPSELGAWSMLAFARLPRSARQRLMTLRHTWRTRHRG